MPRYFEKEVIPYIPNSSIILDIGCGTGILAHKLSETNRFDRIVGIDINEYPEWPKFSKGNVELFKIEEDKFDEFLKELKPKTIVLTWTLHHMDFDEQERYIKKISSVLDEVTIVILEDSFSEELPPEEDIGVFDSFSKLNKEDKISTISIQDWLANRILERRDEIPIPFTYRTLEEWQSFFESKGFHMVKKRFIGFPENRDVNTPQSLIVVKK